MSKGRTFGLMLAGLLVTMVIAGAALLIALDFAGPDGLAHVWSATTAAWSAPNAGQELLERRLKGFSDIDLFVTVKVPGSDLQVHTGTSYANAQALAEGRAAERWCYVERGTGAAVSLKVELGRQTGEASPVLIDAQHVPGDQVRQLGLTADALADLARRHCRFTGPTARALA